MNQFNKAKENGLSVEQERNLNIIRGCVIASSLDISTKKKLCDFILELEEYFCTEEDE